MKIKEYIDNKINEEISKRLLVEDAKSEIRVEVLKRIRQDLTKISRDLAAISTSTRYFSEEDKKVAKEAEALTDQIRKLLFDIE